MNLLKNLWHLKKNFGIYIHIPFCRQKCFYCDFPSFAGRERLIEPYLAALEGEISMARQRLADEGNTVLKGDGRLSDGRDKVLKGDGRLPDGGEKALADDGRLAPVTLYIGGGTPTLLGMEELKRLFLLLQRHIALEGVAEFTVEANPGTLDRDKLHLLYSSGVSRLSIGVQSFDDGCLRRIGRIHTGQEAGEAVTAAQGAGFANISVDLMYGLPGQTLDLLRQSTVAAAELGVQHISLYGLQLEEGTAFDKMQRQGRLSLPEDELTEAMYDYMAAALPEYGYQRYEISNFARPGFASRHNLSYWQDVPYLGFGSGAHGYWGNYRYKNPDSVEAYIDGILQGHDVRQTEEVVTEKAHIEEFCFLALRTADGISRKKFAALFGRDVYDLYGEVIRRLAAEGLLAEDKERIYLPPLGMKYGNQVFGEFLLPD